MVFTREINCSDQAERCHIAVKLVSLPAKRCLPMMIGALFASGILIEVL